jgi:predicted RNA-binding Zn ribbon-like protein
MSQHMTRLVQGQRESYRQCAGCYLVFSTQNRAPHERWCSPGCRRRAQEQTG